jgi:endonuclease/exonuclease/phosphatase (EEP) superfamily protein YafD
MFIPSILHHRSCNSDCNSFMPETFALLCWNVHKNNRKIKRFKPYLKELIENEKIDILLFQEAHFRDNTSCIFPELTYDAAANLELMNEFYGVLTASKTESKKAQAYLSQGREIFMGSHKSFLLSLYTFKDGVELLILNVHAINFRENRHYHQELEMFLELMSRHKGPMIIAGDFNSWNKNRMNRLNDIKEKLGLNAVPFTKIDRVKSFMGNQLDFIFYRGIELLDFRVIKEHKLSDHNPLLVRFKKI